MTATCGLCDGWGVLFGCEDDCRPERPHAHPCASCRGTGSVPLRDVTADETDAELDRLAELVATQAAEISLLKKRIKQLEAN